MMDLAIFSKEIRLLVGNGWRTGILRRRRHYRSIKITVYKDGRWTVTAPARTSIRQVEKYMRSQAEWLSGILSKKPYFDYRERRKEYLGRKEEARAIIKKAVDFYNRHYRYPVKKIFIKDQRSVWGSCSSLGNLNFNYRVAFLDSALRDYIVVHELCHLKEMNHSKSFWNLVSRTIADYDKMERILRSITHYSLG